MLETTKNGQAAVLGWSQVHIICFFSVKIDFSKLCWSKKSLFTYKKTSVHASLQCQEFPQVTEVFWDKFALIPPSVDK